MEGDDIEYRHFAVVFAVRLSVFVQHEIVTLDPVRKPSGMQRPGAYKV